MSDIGDLVSIVIWISAPIVYWVLGRTLDASGWWNDARRGTAIGVLALPVSLAAYSLYWFIPGIGIILGLPGLVSLWWHLFPFRGAFDEFYGAVLRVGNSTGAFTLWKPTFLWAVCYGLAGAGLDIKRHRQTKTDSKRSDKEAG